MANPHSFAVTEPIWRNEPVLDRIALLSARQEARLDRLRATPGIENARQIGTIAALDVQSDRPGYLSELGPRLLAHFHDRDLLVRPLGNTIYVMPPYSIYEDDLDAIYAAIADVAYL